MRPLYPASSECVFLVINAERDVGCSKATRRHARALHEEGVSTGRSRRGVKTDRVVAKRQRSLARGRGCTRG